MHYHLIGIAGTAMGSLAGLLREKGHRVTGSDEGVYPPMSTMLEGLGIEFARTFSPDNVEPGTDRVVVGNAISRGNPELEAVLDQGLFYTSAADTIRDEFLRTRQVLAVAGTHGKTTTSAILAWILEVAGLSPSFLVGGVCENFGTSFRLMDSPYFVIEADEYDTAYFDKSPKMWHYLPRTAVVTNVEFDHADIYRDVLAYQFAFERFVNLIPASGALVVGWDSTLARSLAPASFAPVQSFGVEESLLPTDIRPASDDGTEGSPTDESVLDARDPRWTARDIEYGRVGTRFTLIHDDRPIGTVEWALPGSFNIRNALAAAAAADAVGANPALILQGLSTFRSVRRRMEVRGEVGGVTVIDDFAHHPSAVRCVIDAARQRYPSGRIVAVLEPRSYTAQRREFQAEFRDALMEADRVVIAGLFHPERYDRTTGLNPTALVEALREGGTPSDYVPEVSEIVSYVRESATSGDIILVMSNGGFGGIHEKLLAALNDRGSSG